MNNTPRMETIEAKILVGISTKMSLSENKTADLWQKFMPQRKNITNTVSSDLVSLQIYGNDYFRQFSPFNKFEKWALVEVQNADVIPPEMETLELPTGLYAIFTYKGLSTDKSIFRYIFTEWLPKSIYMLDNRPHFEVLGEKYKNNAPTSEEDIYIPIRLK